MGKYVTCHYTTELVEQVYGDYAENFLRSGLEFNKMFPAPHRSKFYKWRKNIRYKVAQKLHSWVNKIDYACEDDC